MPVLRRLLCAALLLGAAAPLHARQVQVTDAEIDQLIAELDRRSATARHMLESMRMGRVPVVIGSHHQMVSDVTRLSREWAPETRRPVGLMAASFAPGEERRRVNRILIALDIALVDEIFAEARDQPSRVSWDVIRREEMLAVLGHELSHAYGLVLRDGDVGGQCEDPTEGADPSTSCVVVFENLIRSELGIPLDWGYGMSSPAQLAARYEALAERQEMLGDISYRTLRFLRTFVAEGTAN
ncbi:MAG: hypothetical protein KY453_08895 [Gemmatimonadetes bacterium]|nr:hypothetical protein [Gemmatimonadota bacterium]